MSEVQKADPEARRKALLLIVFGAAIGGLLIAGFMHFGELLRDWILSDPAETAFRARLAICLMVALLALPLVGLAVYVWLIGARVLRTQRFPPPGLRVLHDTPVVSGSAAVTRGHAIQIVAVCLGVGAAVFCLFFWWLTWTPGGTTLIQ
jgi:Na+/phosphate symporter